MNLTFSNKVKFKKVRFLLEREVKIYCCKMSSDKIFNIGVFGDCDFSKIYELFEIEGEESSIEEKNLYSCF